MARIHPDVFDNGLSEFTADTYKIYLISADPGDLTAGTPANSDANTAVTSTNALGNESVTFTIADDANDGRKATSTAINDASVSATGTAIAYAIVNTDDNKVLAVGDLTNQALTSGNTFDLAAVTITLPFTAAALT